jgi:hypothetical protein
MPRELSTKWWNVIRRSIRATPATEHKVACPDCGGADEALLDGLWPGTKEVPPVID